MVAALVALAEVFFKQKNMAFDQLITFSKAIGWILLDNDMLSWLEQATKPKHSKQIKSDLHQILLVEQPDVGIITRGHGS